MIDYNVDGDGVASITWNMADRPMNVMNGDSLAAFREAVTKAIGDKAVKGVIVTSAKNDFVAGADLVNLLKESKDAAKALQNSFNLQKLFRDIEKAGKPFVAAMNGTALGGGYEICLACHRPHRRRQSQGADRPAGSHHRAAARRRRHPAPAAPDRRVESPADDAGRQEGRSQSCPQPRHGR
jgi:enoyl-CoA hydratase/carnithine racemase